MISSEYKSRANMPNISNGNSSDDDAYNTPSMPLTPADLLKNHQKLLSTDDIEEAKNFTEIWYYGQNMPIWHNVLDPEDEHGNFRVVEHGHIGFRFEVLDLIGKGSFGQVVRAFDHKEDIIVAVKIIRNKKRFLSQAMVELNILTNLAKEDPDEKNNIIHMRDHLYYKKHLCIAFDLMSLNLFELIKKNNFNGFSMSLIRRFSNSLVKCLCFLSDKRVIHCDLKPENILLKQRGSSCIRVIDFGSSCYMDKKVYTYIQSRFYRSPEVILGLPYSLPIDMWSLGCILAELYAGFPLFPGENEVDQLTCIMEVCGLPPKDLLTGAVRRRLFFDSRGHPRTITNSKGRKRTPGSLSLSQAINCQDRIFINFLERCLRWDPAERMTPHAAAAHPFLKTFGNSCRSNSRTDGSNSSSPDESNSARSIVRQASQYSSVGEAPPAPAPVINVAGPELKIAKMVMPNQVGSSIVNTKRLPKNKTTVSCGPMRALPEFLPSLHAIDLGSGDNNENKFKTLQPTRTKLKTSVSNLESLQQQQHAQSRIGCNSKTGGSNLQLSTAGVHGAPNVKYTHGLNPARIQYTRSDDDIALSAAKDALNNNKNIGQGRSNSSQINNQHNNNNNSNIGRISNGASGNANKNYKSNIGSVSNSSNSSSSGKSSNVAHSHSGRNARMSPSMFRRA